jgi:glycosyltransferase involved in cell wall biosynthesis
MNSKWVAGLVFSFFLIFMHSISAKTINIFSLNNGRGLQVDRQILREALENLGHTVEEKELWDNPSSDELKVDINISFEFMVPQWKSYAKYNWFIPNPECFFQSVDLLSTVDLILCRTRQAESIFQSLNQKTYFLGFTSINFYDSHIEKDFSQYFHLASSSPLKGSGAVVNCWKQDDSLPKLICITQWGSTNQSNVDCRPTISEEEVHYYHNACGVHLCPSLREGFGHYIMEGLSTGSVVITTDAPPMNEFITDRRCLVPYRSRAPFNLGGEYHVDATDLAKVVRGLIELPLDELKKIGEKNRLFYLQKTGEFHENLKKLMETVEDEFSNAF